jgi:hypothetical protein
MTEQTTDSARAADLAGIRQAALDYMQGWYEGDAERMRRCLHPELIKRAMTNPQTGERRLYQVTQPQMVTWTQQGGGSETPADQRFYEVTVLDVYDEIACARAESYHYVDYLQLARSEGTWLLVNVLYERKPGLR